MGAVYAAIPIAHGNGHWTRGAARQTYHRPQLVTLGLHPVARKLLLINRSCRDGMLSWRQTSVYWL